MEIHFGTSSFISKKISLNKNIIGVSSKKSASSIKTDYKNLHFIKKIFLKHNINYIYFFLGGNFKGLNKQKSLYLNYKLPLKIINYILENNIKKKTYKFIFFGTFLEHENNLSNENKTYVTHKIKLKKKLYEISRVNNFEFLWIKLPLVYGKNLKKNSFLDGLFNKIKKNKKIIFDYKYKKIFLLHLEDLNKVIKILKKNWSGYRNREILPKCEGPYHTYYLINKIKKITNKNFEVHFINKKKIIYDTIKFNIKNFNTKKKFFTIVKNYV